MRKEALEALLSGHETNGAPCKPQSPKKTKSFVPMASVAKPSACGKFAPLFKRGWGIVRVEKEKSSQQTLDSNFKISSFEILKKEILKYCVA